MNICASSDSFGAYSQNREGIFVASNTKPRLQQKKRIEDALYSFASELSEVSLV